MKLELVLLGINKGWETVLEQEGIPFSIRLEEELDLSETTCLIIHSNSRINDPKSIIDYIKEGGLVLFESPEYARIFNRKIKIKKVKYLFPESDSIFADLGVLDLHNKLHIIKRISNGILDKELQIFSSILGKGSLSVIPFELCEVLGNTRSVRKRFPANRKELPSEIVSLVSKGRIRRLILILLKKLFNDQGIPLIQKWYWNSNRESCFSFRVDTDYCTAEEAVEMHRICRDNGISGTWFIDTENKERLDIYSQMEDQEIAFHCDRHRVFKDRETNDRYISAGLNKLADKEISVSGYAAPFGEWNPSLAQVLEAKGFSYSSEFSLNYDDLPYYQYIGDESFEVLQIPIHPISLGRLRRAHFSKTEMLQYYKELIDKKIELNEPINIYHHPSHGHLDIWNEVFRYINMKKLPVMTFEQWNIWWKFRLSIELKVDFKGNNLILNSGNVGDFYLKVTYRNKYCIIPYQNKLDLSSLPWQECKRAISKKLNRKIRRWHWRDLLNDLESFRGKIRK